MKYSLNKSTHNGSCYLHKNDVEFISDKKYSEAFFEMSIDFEEWEDDAYILMPACAYNGNRYKKINRYGYPPMYTISEIGVNAETLITDVPALNPDGSGKIEVTSGDMSVPCVGIFYRKAKKGFLVYTEQAVKDKNIGFSVEAGKIVISYPALRSKAYRFAKSYVSNVDKGIATEPNEKIISQFKIFSFDCDDCSQLFKKFFETRKSLLNDERTSFMYTNALWDIMEKHFNKHNWSGQYYSEINKNWKCGWTGCGMSSYPLLKFGNEQSNARAVSTLDYMTEHQADSGFYYCDRQVKILDDCFENVELQGLHLVRRSGDCLNFIYRHFDVVEPKQQWIDSARKCADGFVKLYDTYGTFGQYVDVDSGKLIVGTSCAGASAISGLIRSAKYFKEDKYLQIAKLAGEMYYQKYVSQGVTNGGIGDALCVPDSESIFAFVEAYVLLYEATSEYNWLLYAQEALHIASSWVVTYRYQFPEQSEFKRLDINTVGSIFANVQNKHSAPGICTSSGDYIYRLYQYTKNEKYLELLLDIISFIPQCISTEEKPIYATMEVKDGPEKLPSGYICERVNMSDWEDFSSIGNVFCCSCWCETSIILTYCELIYEYKLKWNNEFEK